MRFGEDFKRKVNKQREDLEPQQVFMDKLASEQEELSEKKFEVPVKKRKLRLLFFLFLLIFLLFLGRTFKFQVLEHDRLLALAEDNKETTYLVEPDRGVIYDKDGEQLVFNKGSFDLVVYKRRLPDTPGSQSRMLEKIASIVDKEERQVKKEVRNSEFNRVLIAKDLSHEQLILAKTEVGDKPGVRIVENMVRDYEDGRLFAHLIGYTGKISQEELVNSEDYSPLSYVGKAGLEKSYEKVLKGNPGIKRIKKDARGNFLSEELISKPEAGSSLVLEVDRELQRKSIEALKEILEEVGSEKGVVVALDPQNGAVRALVSVPSFDPNLFSQGITQEQYNQIRRGSESSLFNQAIAGMGFPTGSIIKPLIATGALEEGMINANTTVDCEGEIVVDNPYYDSEDPNSGPEQWTYPDWTTHGITDVRKAIAESCNIFFYTVGGGHEDIEGLGAEKIEEWLRKFGWSQKTGIDLPGEGKGVLPSLGSDWSLGRTYHLSIGQGPLTVTPVQVTNAFAAIANGGVLYRLHLVDKLIDGKQETEIEGKVIKRGIADKESLKVVRQGMRQTVTSPSGTAHLLNELPVTSAAKSGTAQTSRENHYHDWLTVFAPYREPEIVLTVLVENVEGDQLSASLVAKRILKSYFRKEQ